MPMNTMSNIRSHEALQRLIDGNRRWVSDIRSISNIPTAAHRAALASAQSPFAVVLSCSDSRVPAEMVFDQGLGSLFVVRVAGNVVAPSLVGSIEFAIRAFGTELVVVMGHTACGAVTATLDALSREPTDGESSENLLDIVSRIRPAVEPLIKSCTNRDELKALATRANVRVAAEQLRTGSAILSERIGAGRLLVVGAEYELSSGVVDFFDVPRKLKPSRRLADRVVHGLTRSS